MENETNVNLDTPNEEVQETVETPTADTEADPIEPAEVDVEQLQATNKRLFERAKKAEAEAKALKGAKAPVNAPASPQLGVEETVLMANGMSEELVNKLKVIAKVQGHASLLKAKNDPIFVAVEKEFERDKKQKEASLPAARGSGGVKAVKKVNTPGLSRDEHRKMVLENL